MLSSTATLSPTDRAVAAGHCLVGHAFCAAADDARPPKPMAIAATDWQRARMLSPRWGLTLRAPRSAHHEPTSACRSNPRSLAYSARAGDNPSVPETAPLNSMSTYKFAKVPSAGEPV